MRRSLVAVFLLAAAACVDVPPNIHAQFAGAGPNDRSNFRRGPHGTAPPVEERVGSADAGAPALALGAADAGSIVTDGTDGGVP